MFSVKQLRIYNIFFSSVFLDYFIKVHCIMKFLKKYNRLYVIEMKDKLYENILERKKKKRHQ